MELAKYPSVHHVIHTAEFTETQVVLLAQILTDVVGVPMEPALILPLLLASLPTLVKEIARNTNIVILV